MNKPYADLTDELVVKAKLIIERYNMGHYTSAGDAILDGVKLGLEMAKKNYNEVMTPEQDNMYQAVVNN